MLHGIGWKKRLYSDVGANFDLIIKWGARSKRYYDGQNTVLDLAEDVPNKSFIDVPRQEVIDWIEIDETVPVVEISGKQLTPKKSKVKKV